MKYVVEIHKEIGVNFFDVIRVTMTENETSAKLLVSELESAFDSFKLRKKTTYRSDGNFKFICIELRKE